MRKFFLLLSLFHYSFSLINPIPLYRHWNCIGIIDNINKESPFTFNVGEIPLIGWRNGDKYIATLNGCKHLGSSLQDGWIDNDGCLVCPYHGIKHNKHDSCGVLKEHDGKLWWSYKPKDGMMPPTIPFMNSRDYHTSYIEIDMEESLPYCAYNSMDLNHPEYVHSGMFGFGSNISPSNFKTHVFPKDRIGIEFEYYAKSNIQTINYDMNIQNSTKNFNQFIYPSTSWSKVNTDMKNVNMIVGVSMLPLEVQKTRWFVTVRHNYMNDYFGENLVKLSTNMILNQDKKQFMRQIKNENMKEYCTLKKVLLHDEPIILMRDIYKKNEYKFPTIDDFLLELRSEGI